MPHGNPYFFWIVSRRPARRISPSDARPIAMILYGSKIIAAVAFMAPAERAPEKGAGGSVHTGRFHAEIQAHQYPAGEGRRMIADYSRNSPNE